MRIDKCLHDDGARHGLWELFWSLFKLSLFVVGGGYVILAVAERVFSRKGWTENGELLDHLPVFQMIPGLIATHVAVYLGLKRGGFVGAFLGVVAVALPALVCFTVVSVFYSHIPADLAWLHWLFVALRAALTVYIALAVFKSWKRVMKSFFAYAVFAFSLAMLLVRVPVVAVLVIAMLSGLLKLFRDERRGVVFRSSVFVAFLLFLEYGFLCFGGGFVLVPMYLENFVGPDAPFLQLPLADFGNLLALTQMTPGPIGVNGVTFFGYRLLAGGGIAAGIFGAIAATVLFLLPGAVLATTVLFSLEKFKSSRFVRGVMLGIRPASLALMSVALYALLRSVFA